MIDGYHPKGPILVIKPVEVKEKSAGGIIIPDKVKSDANWLSNVGQVVAMGDMAYQESKAGDNRFGNHKWCKVGDYVTYGRHVGNNFMYNGEKYIILNDDQILAVVEEPSKLCTDYYKFSYRDPDA